VTANPNETRKAGSCPGCFDSRTPRACPRILALIDAELDRLERARLLLTSSLSSLRRAAKKTTSPGGRPTICKIASAKHITSSPRETSSHQQPLLPIDAIPRRQRRQVQRRNRPATRPPISGSMVLITAAAASANPIDWKLHSGMRRKDSPLLFPAILSRDVSGIVPDVGANVKHFMAGGRVLALCNATYAELVAVDDSDVTHLPDGVDLLVPAK